MGRRERTACLILIEVCLALSFGDFGCHGMELISRDLGKGREGGSGAFLLAFRWLFLVTLEVCPFEVGGVNNRLGRGFVFVLAPCWKGGSLPRQ